MTPDVGGVVFIACSYKSLMSDVWCTRLHIIYGDGKVVSRQQSSCVVREQKTRGCSQVFRCWTELYGTSLVHLLGFAPFLLEGVWSRKLMFDHDTGACSIMSY